MMMLLPVVSDTTENGELTPPATFDDRQSSTSTTTMISI